MRLICGPAGFKLPSKGKALRTVLYAQRENASQACAGEAARRHIVRQHLQIDPCAWDFLSIALSVLAADAAVPRSTSPDGWTREIELDIAVVSPTFWDARKPRLIDALAFLTTDRWVLRFHSGGAAPPIIKDSRPVDADSVVLLSGGLDSLVGTIDLVGKANRLCRRAELRASPVEPRGQGPAPDGDLATCALLDIPGLCHRGRHCTEALSDR
jgi:hypothetical protein